MGVQLDIELACHCVLARCLGAIGSTARNAGMMADAEDAYEYI